MRQVPKVGSLVGNVTRNPELGPCPVQMTPSAPNLSIPAKARALGTLAACLPASPSQCELDTPSRPTCAYPHMPPRLEQLEIRGCAVCSKSAGKEALDGGNHLRENTPR